MKRSKHHLTFESLEPRLEMAAPFFVTSPGLSVGLADRYRVDVPRNDELTIAVGIAQGPSPANLNVQITGPQGQSPVQTIPYPTPLGSWYTLNVPGTWTLSVTNEGDAQNPPGRPAEYTLSIYSNSKADANVVRLRTLVNQFETAGRGPGTISTGLNDPGGKSYGIYQFNTRDGVVQKFVAEYYPKEFAGLKAGTPKFDAVWRKLAKSHKEFADRQHAFAYDQYWKPIADRVNFSQLMYPGLALRSMALKNAVFSTAIQHGVSGGYSRVLEPAAKSLGPLLYNVDDSVILKAIYAQRKKVFPSNANRYDRELNAALTMLTQERVWKA
jgi:hypothetical protein